MSVPEVKETENRVEEELDYYLDGTPSPYVIIKCKDYATDFCFEKCTIREIGCAGSHLHGEVSK